MEVMGTAFTTIAHTSAAGGQGGSSDLQRFKAHHPPTFRGGRDPVVADHWFRQVERVLECYGDYFRCDTDPFDDISTRG